MCAGTWRSPSMDRTRRGAAKEAHGRRRGALLVGRGLRLGGRDRYVARFRNSVPRFHQREGGDQEDREDCDHGGELFEGIAMLLPELAKHSLPARVAWTG